MIIARWRSWLGFGFVHGGERERRGRKRQKIRERRLLFFGYIF